MALEPESWSISKTCNEFDVSQYLIKKARKLQNFEVILAVPEKKKKKKKGNMQSDEIKLTYLKIFESGEFSRLFLGKKTVFV